MSRQRQTQEKVYSELCSDFPVFNCLMEPKEIFKVSETSICLTSWFSSIDDGIPVLSPRGRVKRVKEVKRNYYDDIARVDFVYSVFRFTDKVVGLSCGPGSIISYLNDKLLKNYTAIVMSERDFDFLENIAGALTIDVQYGNDGTGSVKNCITFCDYILANKSKADVFFCGTLQGFHEVYSCCKVLRKGGSCIIRVPTLRNSTVEEALYLLSLSFEKVVMFKPASAEGEDSYFYGRNYKERGISQLLGEHLEVSSILSPSREFLNWLSYFHHKSLETRKKMRGLEYNKTLLESSFQPLS